MVVENLHYELWNILWEGNKEYEVDMLWLTKLACGGMFATFELHEEDYGFK